MDKCIKISIGIFILSLIIVIILVFTVKEKYKNIELFYKRIKPENTIENYKIDIKNDKTKYYKDLVKTFPNDKTYKDMLNNIPIYIINLDRSKDRHKFMKDQMKDYTITNYRFISAVDGKKIKKRENNIYDYEDISFLNNDDTVTNGELGCTLSHLKAISEVLKNNHDYAIICEDDADLFWIRTWDRTIKNIVDDAPEDWEWISLYLSKPEMYDKQESFYLDFFENGLYSTTCYIINRNGCQKIMEKYFLDNKFILDKNIIQSHKWKSHRKKRYVVADAYLPFMVNSYGIHIGFITGFNDNVSMNSTIHGAHTDFHVKCNTQNQENLTKNFIRKTYYDIPNIIHIILISEDERIKYKPSKKYADYKIKVWRPKDINKLNMKNRNEYDSITEVYGKQIIALYEILYQFGGYYSNNNNKILNEDMPNMLNIHQTNDALITTDFIGVTKNHPFLKFVIDNLPRHYQTYYNQEVDISIGNKYLTRMLQMLQNKDDVSPPGIKIGV